MPIYEYHCEKCGEDFECLVLGSEKVLCRKCRSGRIRKRISACGFVSKGSGGETVKKAAGSACGSCSAGSCTSCRS